MGVRISGIQPVMPHDAAVRESQGRHDASQQILQETERRREAHAQSADIEINLRKLEKTSLAFNRRLHFYVNREINRVVVKVIDAETDKVIKEIPPEEIQKLVARIRKAIGLLVDETI